MTQKWNLQDIKPAGASKHPPRQAVERQSQDIAKRPQHAQPATKVLTPDPDLSTIDIVDGGQARKKRIIVAVIIVIVIGILGFVVNLLMGGADITVYPKYKDSTVQATFTAYKDPQAGDLSYELLTLEALGEKQVSATGEEQVSEQTKGTLFIYNEFSSASQRLVKNTRFETPDGLVYRIQESVEVPGYTKDADGKILPGIKSAEVYADGPGEQYNIDATRFTIPGFKGSEQYEKMYAESTDSFSGGFEGSKFIINEEELQTAKQTLHLELRDALLKRLETEKPAGFVVYDDAITFAFDSQPSTEYGDELATIKEQARLQVPIFKSTEFANYLAENTVAGFEGEEVKLEDPFTLGFSYPSATTTTSDIAPLTQMQFTLSGTTKIIWVFSDEKLQSDLSGLSKTALPTVLSGYPAIERAEAVVRPFWNQSFPDKGSEITVITIIGSTE